MTGFIFDTASELILLGLLPLFLTVATVWILWHLFANIDPDDARDFRSFLTFIIVVIPFVMIIYGGLAIIIYDEMMNLSGGPLSVLLPMPSSSRLIITGAVIYIALTVWQWSRWRKTANPSMKVHG